MKEYRKALEIEEREAPSSLTVATSYNNIGAVLSDQGDLEGALKEYRKALDIQEHAAPSSLTVATSYNNVGAVLKAQGDLEGALKEYRKALEILLDGSRMALFAFHPLLAICRYNLGETLASVKEYEEARELATDILDVLPDYKWAYLLLGRALIGLGRIPEAIDSYDEAISRSPNFGDAHAAKLEAEVALRLSQTPGEEGKEEGKADLDLIIEETFIAALSSHPDKADPVDEFLNRKLSSRESTMANLKPAEEITTNSGIFQAAEKVLACMEEVAHLKKLNQRMTKVMERMSEDIERNSKRTDYLEIENADLKKIVSHLRCDVDEITKDLKKIRNTVDRAMELCSGTDGESMKRRRKLKDIDDNLNRRDHVEAILTEWESLVTVAKAVESDMINWDAELSNAAGYACLVAQFVALAPVPQATLAANRVMVAMAFRSRVRQRLQFREIALMASTLPSTTNRAMLILLLALEWSDMHKSTVEELPRWDSDSGKEFRKELFNTWTWLCGSVKKGGTDIFERVRECCNELVKTVGLAGGSEGIFKDRKAPAPPPNVIGKLWEKGNLWKKGKLFLFAGESISASSLTSRLVGGKPLSHASVIGKLHAREILDLLMTEKAHGALSLARTAEKSCEAVSCEALMEIYKAQEKNDVDSGIPSANTKAFFMCI